MPLTKQNIIKIANLANLNFDTKDSDSKYNLTIEEIELHLINVIKFVEQIKTINTEKVNPMVQSLEYQNQRLRTDKVTEITIINEIQKVTDSKQKQDGLYLVPQVISN